MSWECKTDIAWKNGFVHARQYAKQFGNLNVLHEYVGTDGFRLGTWIQRLLQQKNTMLTMERMQQLELLGMKWSPHEDGWKTGHQETVRIFKKQPSGRTGGL